MKNKEKYNLQELTITHKLLWSNFEYRVLRIVHSNELLLEKTIKEPDILNVILEWLEQEVQGDD